MIYSSLSKKADNTTRTLDKISKDHQFVAILELLALRNRSYYIRMKAGYHFSLCHGNV